MQSKMGTPWSAIETSFCIPFVLQNMDGKGENYFIQLNLAVALPVHLLFASGP
jgi:hypothetical protein